MGSVAYRATRRRIRRHVFQVDRCWDRLGAGLPLGSGIVGAALRGRRCVGRGTAGDSTACRTAARMGDGRRRPRHLRDVALTMEAYTGCRDGSVAGCLEYPRFVVCWRYAATLESRSETGG